MCIRDRPYAPSQQIFGCAHRRFQVVEGRYRSDKAILEPGQRWKTDADVRVMRFDRIATAEHRAAATAVEALRGLAKA